MRGLGDSWVVDLFFKIVLFSGLVLYVACIIARYLVNRGFL